MILAIRIAGDVEITDQVREALVRMRLRRKYSAVLLKDSKDLHGLLMKVRNHVAYGEVDSKTLAELIAKRGQPIAGKKVDLSTVAQQLDKKDLEDLGLKPFFRLHPPRGGIDTKIHFGRKKGVLGDNGKKINDLVRKML